MNDSVAHCRADVLSADDGLVGEFQCLAGLPLVAGSGFMGPARATHGRYDNSPHRFQAAFFGGCLGDRDLDGVSGAGGISRQESVSKRRGASGGLTIGAHPR